MDESDLEPRKRLLAEVDIERQSIAALEQYIIDLKKEISRVEELVTAKRKARDAARSVFRS